MIYLPLTEEKRQQWITFLEEQKHYIDGRMETPDSNVFGTPEGDIATGKDLIGTLLAVLTNQTITIN
jgi:hypothetical protein